MLYNGIGKTFIIYLQLQLCLQTIFNYVNFKQFKEKIYNYVFKQQTTTVLNF